VVNNGIVEFTVDGGDKNFEHIRGLPDIIIAMGPRGEDVLCGGIGPDPDARGLPTNTNLGGLHCRNTSLCIGDLIATFDEEPKLNLQTHAKADITLKWLAVANPSEQAGTRRQGTPSVLAVHSVEGFAQHSTTRLIRLANVRVGLQCMILYFVETQSTLAGC